MPGSIGRYFVHLRCHRPLRAEAAPQSDHRYQIPGEAGFEEIRQQVGDASDLLVSAGEMTAVPDAAAVVLAAPVPAPAHACVDKFRRAVEYSGYTCGFTCLSEKKAHRCSAQQMQHLQAWQHAWPVPVSESVPQSDRAAVQAEGPFDCH